MLPLDDLIASMGQVSSASAPLLNLDTRTIDATKPPTCQMSQLVALFHL